jgi:hypothetical protein
MKLHDLIHPKGKRGLAGLTQGERELLRSRTRDAARLVMIELNVSTGAAEFCGIYDYIENGINKAIAESQGA